MFESLTQRLSGTIDRLRGRGRLTEENIREAMREVRIALLEADVALPVVRQFIDSVRPKAIGADVIRSMAERAGAKITEVEGSHVIMVSQPQTVTDVILEAVAAAAA